MRRPLDKLLRFFIIQEMLVKHLVILKTETNQNSLRNTFRSVVYLNHRRLGWLKIFNNETSRFSLFGFVEGEARKKWRNLVNVKLRILCAYR